jgi:RNA polymerase sigma factor (sigma-70 family)
MPRRRDDDPTGLVRACVAGDPDARRRFQERYAEDVYGFPVKLYRLPADEAAEFYLYVFEQDRIFTRLAAFEGRNAIQLRTFLAYYVLRSLFLDWQRGRRSLDTVSLQSSVGGDDDGCTLEDVLPHPEPADEAAASPAAQALWDGLSPEDRLDLKLLSLLEHDLDADEMQLLSRVGRRPLAETVALVAEVQAGLRRKDVAAARLRDELDSGWGWIVLRRRERAEVDAKLALLGPGRGGAERARLEERARRLDETIAKRERQRARLLTELRELKITTGYAEIARLRNTTVGTVCSRYFRLRQRLSDRWATLEGVA